MTTRVTPWQIRWSARSRIAPLVATVLKTCCTRLPGLSSCGTRTQTMPDALAISIEATRAMSSSACTPDTPSGTHTLNNVTAPRRSQGKFVIRAGAECGGGAVGRGGCLRAHQHWRQPGAGRRPDRQRHPASANLPAVGGPGAPRMWGSCVPTGRRSLLAPSRPQGLPRPSVRPRPRSQPWDASVTRR